MGLRAVGQNSIFIAAHGVTFVANVALTILLARYLAIDEFVDYAQISAFINMMVPVCTFGLIPFVIRQLKNVGNRDYDLRFVTQSVLVVGALASLTAVVGYSLFGGLSSLRNSVLCYVVILVSAIGLVSNGVSRVTRRPWNYFFIGAVGRSLSIVMIAIAFAVSRPWRSVEAILVCTAVGLAVPLLFSVRSWFPPHEPDKERALSSVQAALSVVLPITLSNMVVMSTPFLERLILRSQVDDFQAAQYIFNYDLALKSLAIITLFMKLIVYPTLASGDPVDEARRFRRIVRMGMIGLIPAVLFLVAASMPYPHVLEYFTDNSQYANSVLFILIGIYSLIFMANYVVTMGVMLTGDTRSLIYSSLIFTCLHVSGVWLFSNRFGAVGVCISLIVSQLLSTFFCYRLGNVRRLIHA